MNKHKIEMLQPEIQAPMLMLRDAIDEIDLTFKALLDLKEIMPKHNRINIVKTKLNKLVKQSFKEDNYEKLDIIKRKIKIAQDYILFLGKIDN